MTLGGGALCADAFRHFLPGDGQSRILERKAGHFDASKFKEYEAALKKLVKRKAAGKTIEAAEPQEDRSNAIDLMDALKQSMKGRKPAGNKSKRPRKRKAG